MQAVQLISEFENITSVLLSPTEVIIDEILGR